MALVIFGLKLSVEFTGGSIVEVQYQENRPSVAEIRSGLESLNFGYIQLQEFGDKGLLIRTNDIPEETHQAILKTLGSGVTELRFDSVGPVIGKELKGKTFVTVLIFR